MSLEASPTGEFVEDVLERIHADLEAGKMTIHTALSGLCFVMVMILISENQPIEMPIRLLKNQYLLIRKAIGLDEPKIWN